MDNCQVFKWFTVCTVRQVQPGFFKFVFLFVCLLVCLCGGVWGVCVCLFVCLFLYTTLCKFDRWRCASIRLDLVTISTGSFPSHIHSGNIGGAKLLGKCLSDIWILHIALALTIASMTVTGLAEDKITLFIGKLRSEEWVVSPGATWILVFYTCVTRCFQNIP